PRPVRYGRPFRSPLLRGGNCRLCRPARWRSCADGNRVAEALPSPVAVFQMSKSYTVRPRCSLHLDRQAETAGIEGAACVQPCCLSRSPVQGVGIDVSGVPLGGGAAMSEHKIGLEWKRESERFTYDTYNREHVVTFGCGARVSVSAAPAYRGNPALVNPEEGLVAALSSCHMLTFLAVAAKTRFIVERYSDHAAGILGTR